MLHYNLKKSYKNYFSRIHILYKIKKIMKAIIDHYIISIDKIEREISKEIKKEKIIRDEINKLNEDFVFEEIYHVCELL